MGCYSSRERVSLAFKEQGNAHFGRENWEQAADMYTLAIRMAPRNHKALCNRACCFLKARARPCCCCCRGACCW